MVNVMSNVEPNTAQLEEAFRALNPRRDDVARQLRHRLDLARFWSVKDGDCVLEIGCGQGDTTAVLATLVGESGRVVAVDKDSEAYGTPTLGESHAIVKSLPLGARIDFLTSTNLLAPKFHFPRNHFNLVVFSHSSWYMGSVEELQQLLTSARVWAKRLGYAEWDLRPQYLNQTAHLIAVLLQAHIQAIHLEQTAQHDRRGNIRTIVLPGVARKLAEDAGWKIVEETVRPTSTALRAGRSSEIAKAITMAKEIDRSLANSEPIRELIRRMSELLTQVSSSQNISLSTYAFTAE
jgi:SAM-dependent methyltransferase